VAPSPRPGIACENRGMRASGWVPAQRNRMEAYTAVALLATALGLSHMLGYWPHGRASESDRAGGLPMTPNFRLPISSPEAFPRWTSGGVARTDLGPHAICPLIAGRLQIVPRLHAEPVLRRGREILA
jgi:hypothetical protein